MSVVTDAVYTITRTAFDMRLTILSPHVATYVYGRASKLRFVFAEVPTSISSCTQTICNSSFSVFWLFAVKVIWQPVYFCNVERYRWCHRYSTAHGDNIFEK